MKELVEKVAELYAAFEKDAKAQLDYRWGKLWYCARLP